MFCAIFYGGMNPLDRFSADPVSSSSSSFEEEYLKPKAKPKPRQPLREEPGTIVAEGKKRKVEDDPQCTCTCKARRLIDALTDD